VSGKQLDSLLATAAPKGDDGRGTGKGSVRVGYLLNQIYDADKDLVRYPTRQDLDHATVVALAMPEVNEVLALFEPKDVVGCEDILMADVMLRRVKLPTRMDIMNRRSIPAMIEMCRVASGDHLIKNRSLMYHAFITCPMKYGHDTMEFALEVMRHGIWVRFGGSMATAGVSAPVTLAGTLTVSLAEIYTGLVMSELFDQYWEVGIAPITMDQQTGASLYNGPDRTLMCLATRDLLRYLGVEMRPLGALGHVGASDACKPGIQAGIEKTYNVMCSFLAGIPPYLCHGGVLGPGGLVGSVEQIVIDCELMSIMNRLAQGIEVTDETIALDLIFEMGFDGQYIEQEHTVENYRRELWLPQLMRRLNPSAWNAEKPDMLEAAKKKVIEILATTDPRALDSKQEKELDRIVAAALNR
jgi:trimethylamine--corrinoid protein Co-methyltransferase